MKTIGTEDFPRKKTLTLSVVLLLAFIIVSTGALIIYKTPLGNPILHPTSDYYVFACSHSAGWTNSISQIHSTDSCYHGIINSDGSLWVNWNKSSNSTVVCAENPFGHSPTSCISYPIARWGVVWNSTNSRVACAQVNWVIGTFSQCYAQYHFVWTGNSSETFVATPNNSTTFDNGPTIYLKGSYANNHALCYYTQSSPWMWSEKILNECGRRR